MRTRERYIPMHERGLEDAVVSDVNAVLDEANIPRGDNKVFQYGTSYRVKLLVDALVSVPRAENEEER